MTRYAIQTRGLTRRFGSLTALQGLDLTIPRGSFCALLGPSGAGKTTTLKLLLGLMKPTAGTGQILGTSLDSMDSNLFQRVGYLADLPSLPGSMTVAAYLKYLRPFYATWDVALERTLADELVLPLSRKIKKLSRGNQLKVCLISRLAYRPELLLLDEPFAGIDVAVRDQLVDSLLNLAGVSELTVLISSHDLDEIERLVDQVVMLCEGQLVIDESTDNLLERFRQITITGDPLKEAPFDQNQWLSQESAGRTYSGVFTGYRAQETEAALSRGFARVDNISVTPMSLRSVVATLSSTPRQLVTS